MYAVTVMTFHIFLFSVPYNQLKSHQLPPFIKLKNANGTEDIHYSIFYDGVPEEFKNIARVELDETEEKKKNGIERLRAFLKGKKSILFYSCTTSKPCNEMK